MEPWTRLPRSRGRFPPSFRSRRYGLAVGLGLLVGMAVEPALAADQATLISHAAGDPTRAANGESIPLALGAAGRVVLLESRATDLVPGFADGNGPAGADLFLHDRTTGATVLVSHVPASPAAGGDGPSVGVALSGDGRMVLFLSRAADLVPGLAGGGLVFELFLHDRDSGTTSLVSHAAGAPSTAADGLSFARGLSADGRVVLFDSEASDLVTGFTDGNGPGADVFVYERDTGHVGLVSHSHAAPTAGAAGLSIGRALSAEGRWVLFHSSATDLAPGLSDANGAFDVFLHDRDTGVTALVSHGPGDATTSGNGPSFAVALSDDGRVALLESLATDLVPGFVSAGSPGTRNVFLHDRDTGVTTLVSHAPGAGTTGGNGSSVALALSADGRVVLFRSLATDLVPAFVDANGPGAGDLFLYDRDTGVVRLVSHATGALGTGGNAPSATGVLSADGRFALWAGLATDLVPGFTDGNGGMGFDVFLYNRVKQTNRLVSRAGGDPRAGGDGNAFAGALGADGHVILFGSRASDVADGLQGTGTTYQAFLWSPGPGNRFPSSAGPVPRAPSALANPGRR